MDTMKLFEKTVKEQEIYSGRIIRVHLDDVVLENGSETKREVVDHPGGVSVAVLTENNELILVRQFRYPYKQVLLELPAGKLEPGEDPRASGLRELAEETGLTPEEIASVELATGAPESLQQETAEGLTLESTLGTDSPEERMVEHIALREAIDQLPEREKMTILLRFFKGLTQEQTARILGVSQVQISRLERRGLKRLREFLSP